MGNRGEQTLQGPHVRHTLKPYREPKGRYDHVVTGIAHGLGKRVKGNFKVLGGAGIGVLLVV